MQKPTFASLPLIFAALAATFAATASHAAVELTAEQRAAIEARIAPVGDVCLKGENCGGMPSSSASASSTAASSSGASDAAAMASASSAVDGEATYNSACVACHASGAGGAPIVGDTDAWAPRIAKGMDALYDSGINGIAGSGMLAKGGRSDLSDEAVMAAVDYMVENSQ